jgi:hypothetical protein
MRALRDTTPYEVWYGKKPDVLHLREISCQAYVLKQSQNPKIYNRSLECTLIGYLLNSVAYQCLNKKTGQIHTSRDVVFRESQDLEMCPLHPRVIISHYQRRGREGCGG